MAEIVKRNKALSVSPLKASSSIGAALAFLGIDRCIPMLHGSQGCTAFGKVFFVRHFREPIPLQTTAMDQVSTVMGGDDNVVEGLRVICEKSAPALIGLPTTGLTETQGSDIKRTVTEFRAKHPEYAATAVVPVVTPDFVGCLETGWAKAVTAMIDVLVPETTKAGARKRQVTILPNASLTPGDIEEIVDVVERFGLRSVVFPDISDSLGWLPEHDFSPLTSGGCPVPEIETLGESAATLVIGASMGAAADLLKARTGVPDHRFDHLMGLKAMDAFVSTLHAISGTEVPARVERRRAQLQDAMLDCHFMLGQSRFAIAADPDLLLAFSELLEGMGAETVAAVAPVNAASLARLPAENVKIGDLEDLEKIAAEKDAEVLIGNSHAVGSASRLGTPLLRAGFPLYDHVGGFARTWVGYRGSRDTLFEFANMLQELERGEVTPYRSIFAEPENAHAHHPPADRAGLRH